MAEIENKLTIGPTEIAEAIRRYVNIEYREWMSVYTEVSGVVFEEKDGKVVASITAKASISKKTPRYQKKN